MDEQMPGAYPQTPQVMEFIKAHARELAAAGFFSVGCLSGYAVGRHGRPAAPGQEVAMASMVEVPKAKHHSKTAAKPKKAAHKTLVAKADSKAKPKKKAVKHG